MSKAVRKGEHLYVYVEKVLSTLREEPRVEDSQIQYRGYEWAVDMVEVKSLRECWPDSQRFRG